MNAPTTDQSSRGVTSNEQFDNTINSGSSWPVAQLPYHSATRFLIDLQSSENGQIERNLNSGEGVI